MKTTLKALTFMTTLTVALCAQSAAFAQTIQVAEASNIKQPSPLVTAPTQLDANIVEIGTTTIRAKRKANWQGQSDILSRHTGKNVDASRWLLKPEENDNKTLKAPKNYAQEFAGLRPAVLANNKGKIGTSTQFIDADEAPVLYTNRSNENLYNNRDDDFLVRAKLNF